MPASAWTLIDITLPEESLKEAKSLENSVQLVNINTQGDATHKHPSLVYLPACKQAIVNHNEEVTAATAKAEEEDEEEEEQVKEEEEEEEEKLVDDQEEEEAAAALREDDRQEDEEEEEEEEEEDEDEDEQGQEDDREKEPQAHLKNSSQSHQSNWIPGDHIDPSYTDDVILVAANNFSSFKKLVRVFAFVLRFVSNKFRRMQFI